MDYLHFQLSPAMERLLIGGMIILVSIVAYKGSRTLHERPPGPRGLPFFANSFQAPLEVRFITLFSVVFINISTYLDFYSILAPILKISTPCMADSYT